MPNSDDISVRKSIHCESGCEQHTGQVPDASSVLQHCRNRFAVSRNHLSRCSDPLAKRVQNADHIHPL